MAAQHPHQVRVALGDAHLADADAAGANQCKLPKSLSLRYAIEGRPKGHSNIA
jgi:hypothetical protein